MSDDEDQHSSSLSAESDASFDSETEPDSPPPPAVFGTSSFFSKKRQRSASASNEQAHELHRRPNPPSDGSSRYSKKPKQTERGNLLSSTPNRLSGNSSLRAPSPDPSFSDDENAPPLQESITTPRSVSGDNNVCTGLEVKSALQEITSLLNTVVKRVERVEDELKRVSSVSSSSDSTPPKNKKVLVPLVVRSEVRKMYQTLLEDSSDFDGFDVSAGCKFDSPKNKDVLAILLREVQLANPQFQVCQIRAAVYTYYRSLNQEESLRRRGKQDDRKRTRRRRERLLRKLQERQAMLQRCNLPELQKDKWRKVLVADTMSSEESDRADDDTIVVKPLPWRSSKVTDFFQNLDTLGSEGKTSQAKRQRRQRVISTSASQRSKPTLPAWAISADDS